MGSLRGTWSSQQDPVSKQIHKQKSLFEDALKISAVIFADVCFE
jgi:hypothetical protein